MSKIRNIIIFVAILISIFTGYYFYSGSNVDKSTNLISSSATTQNSTPNPNQNIQPKSDAEKKSEQIITNSLPVLLSIQEIKLDDTVFANPSFIILKDSSLLLPREKENEGRNNPFAPIGSDGF